MNSPRRKGQRGRLRQEHVMTRMSIVWRGIAYESKFSCVARIRMHRLRTSHELSLELARSTTCCIAANVLPFGLPFCPRLWQRRAESGSHPI